MILPSWVSGKGMRRDYRVAGIVLVALAVASLGYLASKLPGRGVDAESVMAYAGKHGAIKPDLEPFAGIPDNPGQVVREEALPPEGLSGEEETRLNLDTRARKALAEKNFMAAIQPLEALIQLDTGAAKPHLLMGLALEGAGNFELARKYYEAAIDRDPLLADAYFGFASSSESLGDLESALGGMRSFLHVQKDNDPYRLRATQARSAIWEWESKLGRGPWGPTKGIPPGFTEAELRRDGHGTGVKMPISGTEQADGSSQYEVKHRDKVQMFNR